MSQQEGVFLFLDYLGPRLHSLHRRTLRLEYFDFEILDSSLAWFVMRKSLNSATASVELENGLGRRIINAYPLWSLFNCLAFFVNQAKKQLAFIGIHFIVSLAPQRSRGLFIWAVLRSIRLRFLLTWHVTCSKLSSRSWYMNLTYKLNSGT